MKTKLKAPLMCLLLCLILVIGLMPTTIMAEEGCPHTNAVHISRVEPGCYGPGTIEYWFCEECWCYFDSADMQVEILPNEDNGYCEPNEMLVIPATGHNFTDDGFCYNCQLQTPVYSKVTSLADINEEDLYIFVAEVGNKTYAMAMPTLYDCYYGCFGHIRDLEAMEGNAVEVTVNEDDTISVVNKNVAEVMFDVNPERDDMTSFGLTTVRALLPNHTIGSFQSHGYADIANDYYGSPYYYGGHYPSTDGGSAWVIDFYTTEVDENTYRDNMDGYTHAEQVARGNIGENIAEGDLLLYPVNFYSVGGAMFTLRFREYPNPETDTTEYYFICGEDWALEGSPGWDYATDTTPTNDTQYAISLYRYDVPTVNTHTCQWSDWTEDANSDTHTRTCEDPECGKTETKSHDWDNGTETKAPKCAETGIITYTCTDCNATKTETTAMLGHDWSDWSDDGVNATDTHTRACKRQGCGLTEQASHGWSNWTSDGEANHTKSCSLCSGTRTNTHDWGDGDITKQATHYEEGIRTFTCSDCLATKTEAIAKIADHQWTDWEEVENGHFRQCKCNAEETLPHNWSQWTADNDNGYKRVCVDCSASESMILDEEKPVNTTDINNVANTNLTNTDIELIDKVLSDEEQSKVAEGAEVKVYLKVEDISNTAPATHITEAEAKAGDSEIGMYLDIDLFKQVGNEAEAPVTETEGTVNITITIPEELINTNSSVTRTYKIIRVHEIENGVLVTDVIDGKFNPEDNSFTFATDKFSTYALAYADESKTTPAPNPTPTPKPNNPDVPQTGDTDNILLWIALIIVCFGVIGVTSYGKKKHSK